MRRCGPIFYVLGGPDGHTPEPLDIPLTEEGATRMAVCADQDRQVAWTERGDLQVSTVFLNVDHNWFGDGPPLLFETMVFRGSDGTHVDEAEFPNLPDLRTLSRCSTWAEAEAQHRATCQCLWGDDN